MKERVRVQEDYGIVHIQKFSQSLRIKVKIGQFSPYFPHGGQFHLYGDMIELATGSRKVYVFSLIDLYCIVVDTATY